MTSGAFARYGPDRTIVWLASYPKSGSTWLRALFTAYLCPDEPLDLNALLGAPSVFDRALLDDHAAIDSATMTLEELIPYQASLHRAFAGGGPQPNLVKTHSAFTENRDGTRLFPAEASAGAIVIVRDPRDVVSSYAHHEGKTKDAIIARMADEQAAQDCWADRISKAVPQRLAGWSTNVSSWLDQDHIPVCLVRYENLSAETEETFARALEFCGIAPDRSAVSAAVEACRFERLAAAEAKAGFSERPAGGRSFFRSGEVGGSKGELTADQERAVRSQHRATMDRLDYLED
uniref:sulfotransferase domain-containing protein n=1 Tax=Parerythrobacter lutipelagi TaxID=1964208 RepID=UPI0013760356|nr:sulfotransferase domain-containing protein [Parerythrobacter lutipelagi]